VKAAQQGARAMALLVNGDIEEGVHRVSVAV
jgi:hypothetical protein